jgi:hypothetical protein
MITWKRSLGGTILFVILALVHSVSAWRLIEMFYYYESIDFLELSAELFQLLSLLIYLGMVFVAIKKRTLRYAVGIFFLLSLVDNLSAFAVLYTELQIINNIFLCLVVVDLLAVVALFMRPTSKICRVTPFYAVDDHNDAGL